MDLVRDHHDLLFDHAGLKDNSNVLDVRVRFQRVHEEDHNIAVTRGS